jgi:uridine phosphorylase
MTELFHLGVTSSMVPTSIVLIDSDLICDASSFDGWRPLSIRREYVNGLIDGVLICAGAYGSPAAVIALEELVRAGARQCVTLSRCHCVRCLSENYHRPVIATGAVRDERISNDYAPRDFPAVPSHELRSSLRELLPGAHSGLVRTVNVRPRSTLEHPIDAIPIDAVDLVTSALFVVSSAIGIRTASVVLSAIADTDEIAKTVTAAIRALQTMERSTNN